MDKEISALKEKIRSDNWETCKSAVDRLAEINTEDSTTILLDMLRSGDSQIRNLSADAMRETHNQKYFTPLIKRIKELGAKGQIGTLVCALENLDCSRNLYDIADLNLNAGENMEIKQSTTAILNRQAFRLTNKEFEDVKNLLDKFDYTIDGFDVRYKMED